jgi:hypothetical protein
MKLRIRGSGPLTVFKTDCGTFLTSGDEAERPLDLRFPVSSIPLSSLGFPANCGPNVAPL